MSNPIFTKSYTAEATIAPFRIVANGAADGGIIQAASATALMFGVTGELGADDTECLDVHQGGQPAVEYGGVVTRGAPLTSDSIGRAVVAAPATGVNNRIIGFASVAGVSGDIVEFNISIHTMQGA